MIWTKKKLFLNILQLIEVSSRRGAWKGSELESVAIIRKSVVEKLKEHDEIVEETSEINQSEEDDVATENDS